MSASEEVAPKSFLAFELIGSEGLKRGNMAMSRTYRRKALFNLMRPV